jgi:hypothetical protein
MKKTLILFLVVLSASATELKAQNYKNALGIRLSSGDATVNNSVSFKHFLNDKAALEALITFDKKAAIGGLYEIHTPIANTDGLQWFYGGGAYISFDSDKNNPSRNLLGAQGVVGLDYKFSGIPLNLSLDWKPELNIIDNINFEPAAIGFSIRFTFGKK